MFYRIAADIPRLAEVLLSLLSRDAALIRSGRRLVYSTCSLEPDENEELIGAFLKENAQFRVIEPNAPTEITFRAFVKTFPHIHGADGFFATVLERL
ncbi:MAG TPA: hypothetical protein VLU47_14455 [Blastocatellia bacterium]|nr:hypothetical protein [Blastocatellia bacterium]